MSIYTKNGDKGYTSTLTGLRVSKSSPLINCLGDVDELNSMIGILLANLKEKEIEMSIRSKVKNQQVNLLKVGAMLAAGGNEKLLKEKDVITETDVVALENDIDEWQAKLPELQNFILPGGEMTAALAHHARVICRRAERNLVEINDENLQVAVLLKYMNRLSDWLFVLARKLNGGRDVIWDS
jgi:cob(I)alamin adenosyltransferase